MGKSKMAAAKPTKSARAVYTEYDLQNALTLLRAGRSYRAVSEKFGIPTTTLHAKLKGISKPTIMKKGIPCILGDATESRLVDWISTMSAKGVPVTKSQLLDSVQMLVKSTKRATIFKNCRPGRHWYEGFRKRQPEVCSKLSQSSSPRNSLTEQVVRGWFERTRTYLDSNNLLDLPPSRIFTCDEAAFRLSPKENSLLVKKGDRSNHSFIQNDEKECLTGFFCGNAAGQLVEPMITFPYTRIPPNVAQLMPQNWGMGRSQSGWMNGISFYEWVTNIFYKWLVLNEIEFPVVLYQDGHVAHSTLELNDFCKKNKIEIISICPNASAILQPMDPVFRSLGNVWKKAVLGWRMENNGDRVKRNQFAVVLKRAVDDMEWNTALVDAFRNTGLHPFSVDVIDFNKYFKVESFLTFDGAAEVNRSIVEGIERFVGERVAGEFLNVADGDEWTGELCHTSLFEFWRKMKAQS